MGCESNFALHIPQIFDVTNLAQKIKLKKYLAQDLII
jgi:hypothetical protein